MFVVIEIFKNEREPNIEVIYSGIAYNIGIDVVGLCNLAY
jgi:hypothetical protein